MSSVYNLSQLIDDSFLDKVVYHCVALVKCCSGFVEGLWSLLPWTLGIIFVLYPYLVQS